MSGLNSGIGHVNISELHPPSNFLSSFGRFLRIFECSNFIEALTAVFLVEISLSGFFNVHIHINNIH